MARPLAILLFLLLVHPCRSAPIRVVAIENPVPLEGSTAGAFRARVDGTTWVFKGNQPISTEPALTARAGNVEGEYLASRLLGLADIKAPATQLVKIQGREGLYAMTQFVGDTYHGDPVIKAGLPPGLKAPQPWHGSEAYRTFLSHFDVEQIRTMQVVDLVMGNGDRWDGNYFLRKTASGRYQMIPIDHNWALVDPSFKPDAHLFPDMAGAQRDLARSYTGTGALSEIGQIAGGWERILERNSIYEALLWHNDGIHDYAATVKRVRAAFSDQAIAALVAELPPEVSAARRAQIRANLIWRRNNVLPALREAIARARPLPENASVTERIRRVHRLTSAEERLISEHLVARSPEAPGGYELRLEATHKYLVEHGATPSQATAEVQRLARFTSPLFPESVRDGVTERVNAFAPNDAAGERRSTTRPRRISRRVGPIGRVEPLFSDLSPTERNHPFVKMQELDWKYQQLDRRLKSLRRVEGRLSGDRAQRNVALQQQIVTEQVSVLENLQQLGQSKQISDHPIMNRTSQELRLKTAEHNQYAVNPVAEPAAARARAVLWQDLAKGGIVTNALIGGLATYAELRLAGAPVREAQDRTLKTIATPEFLVGSLLAGTAGAALGALVPVSAKLVASGFLGGVVGHLPSMAGAFLAAELGTNAIRLHREKRLTLSNLLSSLDLPRTAAQILLSATGVQLAVAATAAWGPLRFLGPIAPVVGGLAGAMLAGRLVEALRPAQAGAHVGPGSPVAVGTVPPRRPARAVPVQGVDDDLPFTSQP